MKGDAKRNKLLVAAMVLVFAMRLIPWSIPVVALGVVALVVAKKKGQIDMGKYVDKFLDMGETEEKTPPAPPVQAVIQAQNTPPAPQTAPPPVQQETWPPAPVAETQQSQPYELEVVEITEVVETTQPAPLQANDAAFAPPAPVQAADVAFAPPAAAEGQAASPFDGSNDKENFWQQEKKDDFWNRGEDPWDQKRDEDPWNQGG